MPRFFYNNGYAQKEEVFPEAVSRTLPHSYHCLNSKGDVITLHRDTLQMVYSSEEIAEMRLKQQEERTKKEYLPPLV